MKASLCGRAELLLALADGAPSDLLPAMAVLLGFEEAEEKEVQTNGASVGIVTQAPRGTGETAESTAEVPFWRVTACRYSHAIAPIPIPPRVPAPWEEEIAAPPDTPPLTAWNVLLPYLRRAAMRTVPSPRPDIDATIRRLSRGELLPTLPRKQRRAWGMQAHIILDRSLRLVPYWQDQIEVYTWIKQLFPVASVAIALYWDGMDTPVFDDQEAQAYTPPDPGTLVIVLGDLGHFSTDSNTRQVWQRLGAQLLEHDCRPLALLPTSRNISDPYWQILAWERRVPPRAIGAFPEPEESTLRNTYKQVEQLLTLLSPAIRIEPGLLREVRRLLGVDAALEAHFWQHPDLNGTSSVAATLEHKPAKIHRARFDNLDDQCRETLLSRLCAWRKGLPAEIWFEECYASSARTRQLLENHPTLSKYIQRAKQFYTYLGETINTDPTNMDARAWVRRMGKRIAARADQPEILQRDLDRLWSIAHADEPTATPPAGYNPANVPAPPTQPVITLQVLQNRGDLLFLEAPDLHHLPPGRHGSWLGTLSTRNRQITLETQKPFWLDETPSWASSWGMDEYGLWVEFVVNDVSQRLRWIPPGQFLMGSPESEPERYDVEGPQHEVTLTEGFWLFDTAVTQALWEAVMDDNPSRFKGPDRPVENVSWDDAQEFLTKLNGIRPGLGLTLPTEAQWEYACRAGTQTPFYFGDNITLEQVNYNGKYSYNDSPKGLYREETVAVKSLPPNAWGLYEMHGNVWECCKDYWRKYSAEAKTDPTGPTDGGSRIFRGGSWSNDARNVRAAYRGPDDVGVRNDHQGFRCARVQNWAKPAQAEPEQGGAELLHWRADAADRLAWPRAPGFILRSDGGQLGISSLHKPTWAKDIGRDRYGLWAEFKLDYISQRLRWIPPGRFLMGSPESEPERFDDEGPQHEVTLTEGFWLFDTAVTQALWEAVMGENPSGFKGPDRPVENVSWDDAQKFITKLNSILPGLGLTLPTEAQWEYACRAGTQTPFYFGDNIRPEQVNYNGDHPYNDAPKGLYREKTVAVKSLPPNAWGLYEMHGNVWEWCKDYWGDYSAEEQTNPTGPTDGGSRVVRGGSWGDYARNVRAAFRGSYDPGNRYNLQGFRCARVQA